MKKTHYLMWASVFSASLNVIMNIIFIPSVGIVGAAIATFASYLSLACLTYIIGQRLYAFPIDWIRLGKLLLASGLTILVIFTAEYFSFAVWEERLIKVLGLLVFPIFLVVSRFISPAQVKMFWDSGKSLITPKKIMQKSDKGG